MLWIIMKTPKKGCGGATACEIASPLSRSYAREFEFGTSTSEIKQMKLLIKTSIHAVDIRLIRIFACLMHDFYRFIWQANLFSSK